MPLQRVRARCARLKPGRIAHTAHRGREDVHQRLVRRGGYVAGTPLRPFRTICPGAARVAVAVGASQAADCRYSNARITMNHAREESMPVPSVSALSPAPAATRHASGLTHPRPR